MFMTLCRCPQVAALVIIFPGYTDVSLALLLRRIVLMI